MSAVVHAHYPGHGGTRSAARTSRRRPSSPRTEARDRPARPGDRDHRPAGRPHGVLTGPPGARPMNAATAVPTPSTGFDPEAIASPYAARARFSRARPPSVATAHTATARATSFTARLISAPPLAGPARARPRPRLRRPLRDRDPGLLGRGGQHLLSRLRHARSLARLGATAFSPFAPYHLHEDANRTTASHLGCEEGYLTAVRFAPNGHLWDHTS